MTRSGLGRPLPSLIRSSSRRRRDRLDDIRCAPVINSLSPRAASVVSPWAAQPVAIPTSATIVAPNSAFVIARSTTIVIPRSRRQAGTDDTGTVTVRSLPVVSTGNAQGRQGSTDLRLSTLDRQRDAALRRASKGEQYRTCEGRCCYCNVSQIRLRHGSDSTILLPIESTNSARGQSGRLSRHRHRLILDQSLHRTEEATLHSRNFGRCLDTPGLPAR